MKSDGSLPFELLGKGMRGLLPSFVGIQVNSGHRIPKEPYISLGVSVLLLWMVSR